MFGILADYNFGTTTGDINRTLWAQKQWCGDTGSIADYHFSITPEGTISETGSGTEYMPPYITVYAWYRTA